MALMALARGFFLIACFPVRVCSDCAVGAAGSASGGSFWCRPAGPWPGAAGGGSGGPGRSRQSQTGALVPYARGTLRLQHVTFFNWCEPPMGASLSVSMGLISPERRNLFSSDPGVAPRPCAVPSGRRVPLGPIPVPCGVLPAAPLAVAVLGACPPGSCWSWTKSMNARRSRSTAPWSRMTMRGTQSV